MSKIVVLDAGHGGKDSGAVNGNRYEKNDTLRMAKQVETLLKKQGVKVIQIRDNDEYVNIHSRPKIATQAKADCLVSIHRNSFSKPTANGTEIWIHPQARTSGTLATCILERLAETGIQSNRGIKKGRYIVLDTPVPACMVELGFISNQEDNRLFDNNFNDYCEDIARGICEFLSVPYNNTVLADNLYRVQIGAFELEENARALLEDIKSKGLEAYLVVPADVKKEH